MTTIAAVQLLARACLVLMFPFSALDKIWHWKNSLTQTQSAGLPGAKAMLVAAMGVEGLTPFCIVSGVWDRPAAVLLAGFCVVTAFLYHPFWTCKDLASPSDSSQGRAHFWEFVKNFGLAGGLMLVIVAGLATPLAAAAPSNWSSGYLQTPASP